MSLDDLIEALCYLRARVPASGKARATVVMRKEFFADEEDGSRPQVVRIGDDEIGRIDYEHGIVLLSGGTESETRPSTGEK